MTDGTASKHGAAGEKIARAFIKASENGELPEALLTADFSAWTTMQGPLDGSKYCHAVQLMATMTDRSLRFSIDAITAEDDRVLIEARSTARLIDGSDYANNYVFSLRIADGKIAQVKEHFNALVVSEKLIPLMSRL